MALAPSTRFNKISWIKNHKNYCIIAKSRTVNSLHLGDSTIAGLKRYNTVWKKYFGDTLNFVIGGDRLKNVFWRAINLPRVPYLEHVIILCGTINVNKDSPFDIAEYLFEIGKYFKERSRNTEIVISGILPRDEYWSFNRIIISKINDILADKCSLHGFCFIYQKFGWARENGMLNPN